MFHMETSADQLLCSNLQSMTHTHRRGFTEPHIIPFQNEKLGIFVAICLFVAKFIYVGLGLRKMQTW